MSIHPKLAQLNALGEQHKVLRAELATEYAVVAKPVVRYESRVGRPDTRWQRIPDNRRASALVIERVLVNRQEIADFQQYWGTDLKVPESMSSMQYYAIPIGGGNAVIERVSTGDDPLIADLVVPIDEWMRVVQGAPIPIRWLKAV